MCVLHTRIAIIEKLVLLVIIFLFFLYFLKSVTRFLEKEKKKAIMANCQGQGRVAIITGATVSLLPTWLNIHVGINHTLTSSLELEFT